MRWVLVGRADTFEALRSGHLQQSLVRGHGLTIPPTTTALLATTSNAAALALLAHLSDGAAWSGEGAAGISGKFQYVVPMRSNLKALDFDPVIFCS